MNRTKFDNDPIPDHIHAAISQAERLADERVWGRVYTLVSGVHDELEGIGIHSGYVLWLLAVVCDSVGRLEEAVGHIACARAMDPADSRTLNSEKIILSHVYSLLQVAGPHDPEVLSLVEAVRLNFPASHPGLRQIEKKLAEAAAAADSTEGRAQA